MVAEAVPPTSKDQAAYSVDRPPASIKTSNVFGLLPNMDTLTETSQKAAVLLTAAVDGEVALEDCLFEIEE